MIHSSLGGLRLDDDGSPRLPIVVAMSALSYSSALIPLKASHYLHAARPNDL
jgi:hypothetical protein